MMDFQSIGKLFLILGGFIALIGAFFLLGGKLFPWLGHLPGDISFRRGNVSVYFPIATSIILSIVLTVVLNLLIRFLNK